MYFNKWGSNPKNDSSELIILTKLPWIQWRSQNWFHLPNKEYAKVYQSISSEIDGDECKYIKLIDFNGRIEEQNCNGFLFSKLLCFGINVNISNKIIYLTRHGKTDYFLNAILGTDSVLSPNGNVFSKLLIKRLISELSANKLYYLSNCKIYTSTMKGTKETSAYLKKIGKVVERKYLDNLNIGSFDGISMIASMKYTKKSLSKDRRINWISGSTKVKVTKTL